MIEMPKRSVTRFFIPLIDVLTLLFCIYLLMPMVAPSEADGAAGTGPDGRPFTDLERRELEQLRIEKRHWKDLKDYTQQRENILEELARLRQEKLDTLQKRIAIQVLEIGLEGKLYYYDAQRPKDRRFEITADNVAGFMRDQQKLAGNKELYLLILYPRSPSGFPLESQLKTYERWFDGVPHTYDVPGRRAL